MIMYGLTTGLLFLFLSWRRSNEFGIPENGRLVCDDKLSAAMCDEMRLDFVFAPKLILEVGK